MSDLIRGGEIHVRSTACVQLQCFLNFVGICKCAVIICAQHRLGIALHLVEVFREKLFATFQCLLVQLELTVSNAIEGDAGYDPRAGMFVLRLSVYRESAFTLKIKPARNLEFQVTFTDTVEERGCPSLNFG